MERKIGEIFEHNGEWYQCVSDTTDDNCNNCYFQKKCSNIAGVCSSTTRSDGKSVAFKKLEKVGEPFYSKFFGKFYQMYKTYIPAVGYNFKIRVTPVEYVGSNEIFIEEIKQNKENMEENKTTFPKEDNALTRAVHAYINGKISDEELIKSRKEMPNEYPYDKNSLKPFSLEAAKAGKPVCTRDGRKARIICFDRIDSTGCNLPIVALIQCEETEVLRLYREDGKRNVEVDLALDLMMLPEKKKGWVNVMEGAAGKVYVGNNIYRTEDEAKEGASRFTSKLIANIPIEWEE